MKYSACIEMLFTEYAFTDRIYQAKKAGFDSVEFWLWKNKDIKAIKTALQETGLEVGVFQGNVNGRMIDPGDKDRYISGVQESIETAKELNTKYLFLMTDILQEDRTVLEPENPIADRDKSNAVKEVLLALKPMAEAAGITMVIEPLNVYVDHMGYHLKNSKPAFDLVKEINSENIKALYDVYHMQIMEGNLISTIKNNLNEIGYVHVADVPGRHEPGTGEINYFNIRKALKESGYNGFVGFEFEPSQKTEQSLELSKKIFEF